MARRSRSRKKATASSVVILLIGLVVLLSRNWDALPGLGREMPRVRKGEGAYTVLRDCRLVDYGGNDGDSFRIAHGDEEDVFRLYFVDTPEKNDRYKQRVRYQARDLGGLTTRQVLQLGREAQAFTLDLLRTEPFEIITRWESVMDSERYYAFVRFTEGPRDRQWLCQRLVDEGLARIYTMPADLPGGTPKYDFKRDLKKREKEARKRKAGAWAY